MAETKKYFYMRLKENFYDSDAMICLESMEDGYAMSNLLMKMYCRSLKGDGRLAVSEKIPYSPEMLSKVTRIDLDIVTKALPTFQELGLIEILDTGAIFMLDIQNYIGQSSSEADRQREYQKRISEERCKKSNKKSTPYIETEPQTYSEREPKTEQGIRANEERWRDVAGHPAPTPADDSESDFERRRREQIERLRAFGG